MNIAAPLPGSGHAPLLETREKWGPRVLVSFRDILGSEKWATSPAALATTSTKHLHGRRRAYAESKENHLSGARYHWVDSNNTRTTVAVLGDPCSCNSW